MRWGRVAVIAGILVVAGGIGAASWGLFAYNEVTKIDRSNPKVVLSKYLDAALVQKDKVGAELYACDDPQALRGIKNLRDDLDARERDFGVSILVTWGVPETSQQGSVTNLTHDLTITARKGVAVDSRHRERWRFTLEEDNGWRVCRAEKVAENPT